MNLTYDEICAMNKVQKEIFVEFIRVCKELGLTYYMVHGSLLGAIRYNDFFPYDDDIDVAMPRRDYDILIHKGKSLFKAPIFLQCCETEERYPLAFAKLRNSDTAFIQPVMKKFNVNQGIYIDIFPLDYYPDSKVKLFYLRVQERLYSARISNEMEFTEKQPAWKHVMRGVSKMICPSYQKAARRRAGLFANVPTSNRYITVGGKLKERGIPVKWFGEGYQCSFSGLTVNCPLKYKAYLSQIYGDYTNYNPAEKYMNSDKTVQVSADKFSTTTSYLNI